VADHLAMRKWRLTTVLIALTGVVACLVFAGPAGAASGCALYASPSGSDSASGSASNPVQSISVLENKLSPGQMGCMEGGSYGSENSSYTLSKSGTATAPITVTAVAGQTVTITGYIDIAGSYVTVQALNIDDSNDLAKTAETGTNCPHPISQSLEINGQNDTFQYNNYYQSVPSLRSNGIGVGWNGQADNTVIRYNRIHDVGQCEDFDHMIYLSHGNNAQIYDNWLWNDPHGWGIQVYPAASGANIWNNVIDGAGSGFVVGGGSSVSNTTIQQNIVINSTGLPDGGLAQGVAISSCCGSGTNNNFTNNVSYNNPGGIGSPAGVNVINTSTANPNLANPAAHDYRPTTAPLTTWGLWDGGLGTYGAAAPAAPVAAAPALPPAPTGAATHKHNQKKHKQHKTKKHENKQQHHKKHKLHHKKHHHKKHHHKKHHRHHHKHHRHTTKRHRHHRA
jgi:hypothetical protein